MGSYSFSVFMISLFVAVSFAIGMLAVGKIKNFREYVFGNEVILTSVTLALGTILTEVSQDYIFIFLKDVINNGRIVVIAYLGITISYFVRAFLIAPHMKNFSHYLTAGDIFQINYGKEAKTFYGVISLFYGIFYAAMQFYAIGIVFDFFFDIKGT